MAVFRGVGGIPAVNVMGQAKRQGAVGLDLEKLQVGKGSPLASELLKDHDERVASGKITMGVDGRVANEPSTIGLSPELAFNLNQKDSVEKNVSVTHSHHDLVRIHVF